MKNLKRIIAAVAAAVLMCSAVGCKHKIKDSSSSSRVIEVGKNKIEVEMSQEVGANDTVFALNSVIDAGAQTESGEHYIYFDVTIKNATDKAYSLSGLNNFRLTMPDNSEVYSHIRATTYAITHFNEKYHKDPFDIPANGEFRGVVGGVVLPADQTNFTFGFFPTKENASDKEDVILIKVDASKITPITDDLLKK